MRTLKTGLATIVVPGTACFLIPYLILDQAGVPLAPSWGIWQIPAVLAGGLGVFMVVWVSTTFVRQGRGTPIPIDPPIRLVVHGLYRYVRNPMYTGAVLIVLAEAAFFRSARLALYAAGLGAVLHAALVVWEEPQLKGRFGTEYEQYLKEVPRWIPKLSRR
jgi:protein-S-isoprenylcysteine O-methyltransferase Ste14